MKLIDIILTAFALVGCIIAFVGGALLLTGWKARGKRYNEWYKARGIVMFVGGGLVLVFATVVLFL